MYNKTIHQSTISYQLRKKSKSSHCWWGKNGPTAMQDNLAIFDKISDLPVTQKPRFPELILLINPHKYVITYAQGYLLQQC